MNRQDDAAPEPHEARRIEMLQKAMFRQQTTKEWTTLMVEVTAATAGSILMLALLALLAYGLGILGG
jgi:hypothetical protein